MKTYPSKILLFGEYSVIKGSGALAIPLHKYGGYWARCTDSALAAEKQLQLPQFLNYLQEKAGSMDGFTPNISQFRKDLGAGWYFESTIPQGYGAGSSGALCAGIYDVYFENKTKDTSELKRIFALMENFFHGSSSGFDPLVCYLDKPVRIQGGEIAIMEQAPLLPGLFLLDTGVPRSTGPLVQTFLAKCQDPAYEQMCHDELLPLADVAIADYLRGDAVSLFHRMYDISRLQYVHFQEMIPDAFRSLWKKSLLSPVTKIKLCGAGGGGFLMGMSKDRDKTIQLLEYPLIFLDE